MNLVKQWWSTRTGPQLACHLGVVILLTIVLIVLNASCSPHEASTSSSVGVTTERFLSKLSINTTRVADAVAVHAKHTARPSEGVAGGEQESTVEQKEVKSDQGVGAKTKPQAPSAGRVKAVVVPEQTQQPKQCKDGGSGPKFNKLRSVEDITQEKDVDLVMDIHRDPQFTEVPMPITTDKHNMNDLCKSYRWKFCTNLGGDDDHRNRLFYTCELRDYIARVPCAWIDGRQRIFGGVVYDHERRFPTHATHPQDLNLDANSHYDRVQRFKALSHNLAVYPFAAAHTFERLPRLFLLIKGLPEDVPVLMAESGLSKGFVDVMDKYGVFPKSRVLWWDPDKIYYADTVYYAGEMGLVPKDSPSDRNNSQWNTLRVEHCSWALSQPRWLMQEAMQQIFWDAERGGKLRVVVVHRKDAGSRMLNNHDELIRRLKSEFKDEEASVDTFVGSEHNVEEMMRIFANADILIAPHGAALTFTSVMRPGAAVIEIGYSGRGGMMWPGNYFHTMVVGSDLKYYATLANGEYGGSLHADVDDVAKLARMAHDDVRARG